MRRLPTEVLTLYAELLDQLTAREARRSIGHAVGGFVTKTIKGQAYVYFQHSLPGGTTRFAKGCPVSGSTGAGSVELTKLPLRSSAVGTTLTFA